jgi:hypothetical protein
MGITNLIKSWKDDKLSHSLLFIKKELIQIQKINVPLFDIKKLSLHDQNLIQYIQKQTVMKNENNIIRTMSYYDFYCKHPEIHWAFLGHMVSRNGGWNMTDLKGELLSRLLTEQEQKYFFHFLEQGNWLIFQDVFPQLLLYEESLKRGVNLFYLLPFFNVSIFMQTLWNYFLNFRDCYILAIGLVINEQSYLEKRVIQNSSYKKSVLNTIEFKIQDLLSLNQILFPCELEKEYMAHTPLIGQTLHHFASLHERISLGKRLYHLLFHNEQNLRQVLQWARKHKHTGSRKDYWPQLFAAVMQSNPGIPYEQRIENCEIKPGSKRLYSPMLRYAWKEVEHATAEIGDWYEDWKVIHYLSPLNEEIEGDIKHVYCKTLEKIEMAITIHKMFSPK